MLATALSTNPTYAQTIETLVVRLLSPRFIRRLSLFVGLLFLSSCAAHSTPEPRKITLQQQWSLNPGDEVAGNQVSGSLGDISIYLDGKSVSAPFDGQVEPSDIDRCSLYSTPEIPAYLFRLCGLSRVKYGEVKAGKSIGKGDYLSFATLRRQPDGTWIIVEPAKGVLEKALGYSPLSRLRMA